MTNDNIHVTNAAMAEASALPIDDFFDNEGNLIPFDIEDTIVQGKEDLKQEDQIEIKDLSPSGK
jgi:hypothetical protein